MVITDFIKNLYGSPPGSGLDSNILYESSTNGIDVYEIIIPNGIKNNRYRVYGSTEAQSRVEKAVKLIGIGSKNYIKINTNSDLSIDINDLEKKINDDINNGYVPIAIISTFGTTGTVSFDDINKTCLLANKYKIWHHVDAAYAGSALFLDEYKKDIKNIKY